METVEKKNCEGKDQANQILNIRLEESCLSFFPVITKLSCNAARAGIPS
jgi:hypothetical protein